MIEGIYPPIPTPFIEDELATEELVRNIHIWNTKGLHGYVVMGSNGESAFLTESEKLKLIETVKSNMTPGMKLIAGTGLESIKGTIELTNSAASFGAEFALVLTPSFYKAKMNHAAFVEYFTRVADGAKIPVIIYNVTKFTNVNIEAQTVAELAEHPNIAGIKNSSENIAHMTEIISAVPEQFTVLAGTASVLFHSLVSGASGGILALANIAPMECLKIYHEVKTGNLEEALKLQKRMIPANKAVTAKFGVAGLKSAMDKLGYFGGLPRKPLSGLTEVEVSILTDILQSADLL